jgi:hypothetical protein
MSRDLSLEEMEKCDEFYRRRAREAENLEKYGDIDGPQDEEDGGDDDE